MSLTLLSKRSQGTYGQHLNSLTSSRNKLPQTWLLKTTHICHLTALRSEILNGSHWVGIKLTAGWLLLKALRKSHFLAFFSFQKLPAFLGHSCLSFHLLLSSQLVSLWPSYFPLMQTPVITLRALRSPTIFPCQNPTLNHICL